MAPTNYNDFSRLSGCKRISLLSNNYFKKLTIPQQRLFTVLLFKFTSLTIIMKPNLLQSVHIGVLLNVCQYMFKPDYAIELLKIHNYWRGVHSVLSSY